MLVMQKFILLKFQITVKDFILKTDTYTLRR